MAKSRSSTRAMIPNTFTQRGVLVSELESGSAMSLSSVARGCRGDRDRGSLRYNVSLSRHSVSTAALPYTGVMPRLWKKTIEAHRREVRDAIQDTTAALVAEHGLQSVTMSQIAEETGVGRATLYKYFADVEAILLAWHERHVTSHLEHLAEVRDQAGGARERLEAVLEAYAL